MGKMAEPKFEVAEIRQITREMGLFGGIFRSLILAERISSSGAKIIARSRMVEWRKSDERYRQIRVETEIGSAYQQILQVLLADGWEPLGTDPEGRVVTLRRRIEVPTCQSCRSLELDQGAKRNLPKRQRRDSPAQGSLHIEGAGIEHRGLQTESFARSL